MLNRKTPKISKIKLVKKMILNKMKFKILMKILIPINYKLNNLKLIRNINNVIIAAYQINSKSGFNLIRVNIIIVLSVCYKKIYILQKEKKNATNVKINLNNMY